jgi:hypothetical protein
MKRAFAVLVMMTGAAQAQCPATITVTEWEDGYVETLTGREGDVGLFTATLPQGETDAPPIDYRMHAGLIQLESRGIDGPVLFKWTTPLPDAAAIVPGASFALQGTQSAMLMDTPVMLTLQVLRAEEIAVAGCRYPVLVVQSTLAENGASFDPLTVWIHMPSLMPLRQETAGPAGWASEVVALR